MSDITAGWNGQYKERGGKNWFNCEVIATHTNHVWLHNTDTDSKPLKPVVTIEFRDTPEVDQTVKLAYELYCQLYPSASSLLPKEHFTKGFESDFVRTIKAGWRKVPSREDVELRADALSDRLGECFTLTPNVEFVLDLIYGEDEDKRRMQQGLTDMKGGVRGS